MVERTTSYFKKMVLQKLVIPTKAGVVIHGRIVYGAKDAIQRVRELLDSGIRIMLTGPG